MNDTWLAIWLFVFPALGLVWLWRTVQPNRVNPTAVESYAGLQTLLRSSSMRGSMVRRSSWCGFRRSSRSG